MVELTRLAMVPVLTSGPQVIAVLLVLAIMQDTRSDQEVLAVLLVPTVQLRVPALPLEPVELAAL